MNSIPLISTLLVCAVTLAFLILFACCKVSKSAETRWLECASSCKPNPRRVSWHIQETKVCAKFKSKWARHQLGRFLT